MFDIVHSGNINDFPKDNTNRHYGFAIINSDGTYGSIIALSFNNNRLFMKSFSGNNIYEWAEK